MRLCSGCDRELIPVRVWNTLTPAQRDDLKPIMARSQARGLCARCYRAAERADGLIDFEVTRRPLEETLQDWYEHRDASRSLTENVRHLAPRLGMSPDALRRAVWRGRRMDTAS